MTNEEKETNNMTEVKRIRAGVGEGETVGVTVQLPKALYEQVKELADTDERTVPHFLLRTLRDKFQTYSQGSKSAE